MNSKIILIPLVLQVFLTLTVLMSLAFQRFNHFKLRRTNKQWLSLSDNTSENFINLFEVPVLFYVSSIVIYILSLTDPIYFYLSLAFVVLRAIHSFVHCTYNNDAHRFLAYLSSGLILLIVWTKLAIEVIIK